MHFELDIRRNEGKQMALLTTDAGGRKIETYGVMGDEGLARFYAQLGFDHAMSVVLAGNGEVPIDAGFSNDKTARE